MSTTTKVVAAAVVIASGFSGTLNTTGPNLDLQVDATAVSGTTPSLTIAVQYSDDGTNWAAPASAQAFAAITAAGNAIAKFVADAPFYRLAYTVTGTTPSFTLNVFQSDF